MLTIYLSSKSDYNDATRCYIDFLKEIFLRVYDSVDVVYDLRTLNKSKCVVTIDAKSFFKVKLRYPNKAVVNWFQGVVPEESKYIHNSILRYGLWSFFEWFTLKYSRYNFFVSEAMVCHYEKKYGYRGKNYSVVPCFNSTLSLSKLRLQNRGLSFIYAGSMHKWQCIDEMVSIFIEISKLRPDAILAIYTKEQEVAQSIIKPLRLSNVIVDSADLHELPDIISQYSYGFLIREDNLVNNVATPTKFCTYLSVGTKPVLTDVIDDFRPHLDGDMVVIAKYGEPELSARAIVKDFETFNRDKFNQECSQLFSGYYNTKSYIPGVVKSFKEFI